MAINLVDVGSRVAAILERVLTKFFVFSPILTKLGQVAVLMSTKKCITMQNFGRTPSCVNSSVANKPISLLYYSLHFTFLLKAKISWKWNIWNGISRLEHALDISSSRLFFCKWMQYAAWVIIKFFTTYLDPSAAILMFWWYH